MSQDELVAALSEILNEILSARDLAQQELLRADELSRLSENTGKRLNSLKFLFSDEWQRKYEKITHNRWKSVLRGGFANIKTYDEHIGYFEEFIKNLITHLTGAPPKRENYISPGHPFDARTRLRSIFKQATHEIILADNFLHPELLSVLQPYVEDVPDLSLKFLTRRDRNNKFNSFVSDFRLYVQQYPSRHIEAREYNQCHDRFIIIDGNVVYHSGHSFHDLGQTVTRNSTS